MSSQAIGVSSFGVGRLGSLPKCKFPTYRCNLAPLTNTNSEATRIAVAGVSHHLIRVRTWSEAVMLCNEYYNKGKIIRVPA